MRKINGSYSIIILLLIFTGLSQNSVSAQCSGELLNISATTPSQTGTVGNVTVPSGGPYLIKVTAKGAKGGDKTCCGTPMAGGSGATVVGEFIVASGQIVEAVAGAPGITMGNCGGGGGGSGARLQNQSAIIIAGGGGGAGFYTAGGSGYINPAGSGNGGGEGLGSNPGNGGGGLFSDGTGGAGAGFNAMGGSGISIGGGGYGGGGGGSQIGSGGGGGGGYTGGTGGNGFIAFGNPNNSLGGQGASSYNLGSNQNNTAGSNNGGGQVIIECLGAFAFTANFNAGQPVCTNPTQGSLSIDLTDDLNGDTNGLEYAIVSGSSFLGTPAFSDITSDPFNITNGFGTSGDFTGKTYTIRIRLKYNPDLFLDNTYTLTTPCSCTIFVNDDATGANNGTSWTDAFTDLQSALNVACNGSEIWVATGTYKPTSGTDRNISFSMKDGVAIYGGFSGGETALGQRNWTTNVTTLSGDIGIPGEHSDNSYHVLLNNNNGLTSTALIDGFTITAGNANGTGLNSVGGGMYNRSVNPMVSNCNFVTNFAAFSGGAMLNYGSNLNISACNFTDNQAGWGGAMSNYAFSGETANQTLVDCNFTGNLGTGGGGAINHGFLNTNGSGLFKCTNCNFIDNVSYDGATLGGGGAFFNQFFGFDGEFINCLFDGNQGLGTADWGGGSLLLYQGSATLINSTIVNSTSATTGGGVSIYSPTSVLTVKNSIFWNNTAVTGNSVYNGEGGTATFDYSLIQESSCPPDVSCGTGMIYNDDPQFVSTSDLHLKFCSPAIDAGTNTGAPPDDLDGNPRPYNGASDIGAYEFQGLVLPMVIETATAGPFDANDTWTGGCPPPNPIPAGFTVNINHAVTNPQGKTITNNGNINVAGGTFTNDGTYQGTGTFTGNFVNNGIVKPGNQNN